MCPNPDTKTSADMRESEEAANMFIALRALGSRSCVRSACRSMATQKDEIVDEKHRAASSNLCHDTPHS